MRLPHQYTHQWRIQAGAHPARAPPPILPNDFTDPARPRPLFHSLFTKSCASIIGSYREYAIAIDGEADDSLTYTSKRICDIINTFVSTLHKILEGATAEVRQQEACLANHSVSICRTLYIQRSVILLREHRLAKQKREITASNRAVGLKSQVVLLETAHSCNLVLTQELCCVRACIGSGVPGNFETIKRFRRQWYRFTSDPGVV